MADTEPVTKSPEQPEPQEPKERHQLMSPTTRNLIVGTAIVVILLTLTAWSGTIRREAALRESLLDDVNALAAAFKYPVLESKSLRTDAGRLRLQPMVEEVSRAGRYHSVTLTDEKGTVLATTLSGNDPEVVDKQDLPDRPWVGRGEPGLKSSAPIEMGGNKIGYLIVVTER